MEKNSLAVIMPIYNEEGCIAEVLKSWTTTLDQLNIPYRIYAYNDGSKDHTLEILHTVAAENPNKIQVYDKKNGGHGHTILQGYQEAAANGAEWIFQIDSDDEIPPDAFETLWQRREEYDFLAGNRRHSDRALSRRVVSLASRIAVLLWYGKGISDVNVPFRLMRTAAFVTLFQAIPEDTFAPNVIISGMAAKMHLRIHEETVVVIPRRTGEVSIKKWKLAKAAIKSFVQTIAFASCKPSKQ